MLMSHVPLVILLRIVAIKRQGAYMRSILAAAALAVLLFGGPPLVSQQSSTPQSPASPLSVADVEHGLKAGVSNTRMAALVKQYGVDFELTDAAENQLRTAGANDELLLKIARAKSSSVASPTSTAELVKQANRYRLGDGVTKDESKAAELYRRAAESGDPEAQTRFGEALFDGRGVPRDRAAAQMWFEKAATQNYALAETDLGVMLEEGLGVTRNQEKALEWFFRGAKHGNGCAEERLGQDAQFGRGVEKSDSLAYGHYSKGTAEGSALAALALSGMYAQGIAVEKDPKVAFTWLMKAGSMKDPEYTSRWTDLCAEGMAISFSYTAIQDAYSKGYGVTKDAREADLWGKRYVTDITEAAKNGWPVAQYKLSLNSTYGIGVPKDYTVAMEWALKAAEQDYAWAELQVAEMYRNGWGVTQDYQQAMIWFRKSADQDNPRGQYWVGTLYWKGLGVKADDQEAMTWTRKAADQGDSDGQLGVGALYARGFAGTGPAYEQAMTWFRKSADQGNPNAQVWIGKLYEKGLGVSQSNDTARIWYQKAADQGNEPAKKYLAALAGGTGGAPATLASGASANRPAERPTAIIDTTVGKIKCTLFPDEAPIAVANFIGLADGTKDWTNPVNHRTYHGTALYDGTIFHRVIPNFMIQGGDPAGNGTGGPGYKFKNEVSSDLLFDKPGRLAFANSGPDTNGSQFFITEVATPHLNGNNTVFGQCDEASVELVKQIARMPRGADDRPDHPVRINHITVPGSETSSGATQTRTPFGSSIAGAPGSSAVTGGASDSSVGSSSGGAAGSVGTVERYQGNVRAATSSNSAGSLDAHDCLQRTSEPRGGVSPYTLAFRNTCAKPVHLYFCYTTAGKGCWGCIMHAQDIETKSNRDYSETIGADCQTQSCSELEVVWNATYVQTLRGDIRPNEIYPKKPNVDDSCSTTAH
jgi:TPR repeat protein